MKSLITLFLIFLMQATLAQEYSYDFNKPTKVELTLKQYEKDKDAPALILYDIGKTSIIEEHDELIMNFNHRRKIKIFNQGGYEYAEIEIPYYVKGYRKESVVDIEAFTYNQTESGMEITYLEPSKIYEEVINDRWKVKKFAFPKVKDGSVIEYKYTLKSPHITEYQDWEFQHDIPVKYSKYEALMNPFYSFVWYLQGATKFDSLRDYDEPGLPRYYAGIEYKHKVYEYIMRDIPAFYDESYITSRDDYIIKINFQLAEVNYPNGSTIKVLSTWPKLSKDLLTQSSLGSFKKAIERKSKSVIEDLNLASESDINKTERISEYVKSNFHWNGVQGYYTSQKANDFLETKSGNCSEINLLLAGLLNNAEIAAHPVLLSTRSHGKIHVDYPYLESFNYLAVLVELTNGKSLLIDATERNLPFHILPARCINDEGLLLKKDEVKWVSLASEYPSNIKYNLSLQFNDDLDSLKLESSIVSTGYDAFFYRQKLHDNYIAQKKYLSNKQIFLSSEAKSMKYKNKRMPFTLAFKGTTPVENVFDKIYISPFAKLAPPESPLKQPEHKYPVDLTYAKKREFTSYITVPDGYSIDYIPKNKEINDRLFNLVYSVSVNDNTINIHAKYEFKKAVYKAEEYKLLKYYYNEVVQRMNEKIVLKKDSE